MNMKKEMAFILAFVLIFSLLTAAAAFAGNDNDKNDKKPKETPAPDKTPAPTVTPSPSVTSSPEKNDTASDKNALKKELKALIGTITDNRKLLSALCAELDAVHEEAAARIGQLVSGPDSVTNKQLTELQNLAGDICTVREALDDTNPSMRTARQALRAAKKGGDDGTASAALRDIIRVQETRMDRLHEMIRLIRQILTVF